MLTAWLEPYRYALPSPRPVQGALPPEGTAALTRLGWHLLVRDEEGHVGCGDVAPWPGVTPGHLSEVLERLLEGPWRSHPCREVDDVHRAVAALELPELRYGLELALLNLLAQRQATTLEEVLGVSPEREVPLRAVVRDAQDAAQKVAAGAVAFKVKVDAAQDATPRLEAIRRVIGDAPLSIDLNRTHHPEIWQRLRAFFPDVVEEPGLDGAGMARARLEGMPVALDESLYGKSAAEVVELLDVVRPAAVILKPDWLGGIARAQQVAEQAQKRGVRAVVSYAWTSEVGRRGALALARTLPEPLEPAGLWSPYVPPRTAKGRVSA